MTKYEILYNELALFCRTMGAGAPLPSVREIMWKYKVSQMTVDRAMDMLRRDSMIETMQGAGSFVKGAQARSTEKLRLALLIHNYPSSFSNHLERSIVRAITDNGHYVESFHYDWNRPVLFGHRPKGFDGIFVVPPRQAFPEEEAESLRKLGTPFVVLSLGNPGALVNSAGTDNLLGGALACDCLSRLGHKRLAVLLSEPAGMTIKDRVRGFLMQAAVAGLPEPFVIDCKTVPGENSFEKAHDSVRRTVREGNLNFSGLFVVSDGSALGALHGFYEEGIHVPDDVSVIGFDDIPEAAFFIPPLSSLRQDFESWALRGIAMIRNELEGKGRTVENLTLPPSLVIRKSTAEYRSKHEKKIHAD